MSDLRQLINGGRPLPCFPATEDMFVAGRSLPFEMMMGGRQVTTADLMPPRMPLHDFVTADHDTTTTTPNTAVAGTSASASGTGTTTNIGGGLEGGGDGGTGRWPRQETLTLLDVRSRLDPKFKEANHKGPLWDEVSRIMCEEHGYQRNGKKCREKFENLYKYYKKTKEGKAGRQDGKHYRFFRQLEALYGDSTIHNNVNTMMNPSVSETHLVSSCLRSFHGMDQPYNQHKLCDSLSLSNSSEFDTCSSGEGNVDSVDKTRKRRGGRSWKTKIKDFIDAHMRKLMEKQEAWLEKMMRTMEQKEEERALRDEQWRKEEAARIDREQKLWAKERAWIETRDAALMEILEKIKGREGLKGSSLEAEKEIGCENHDHSWSEPEITRLIQLRRSLESSSSSRLHNIHNSGDHEEQLWEEIEAKMSCYGYERSATMCKEKWEAINYYLNKNTKEECNNNNKKRKENSKTASSNYFHNYDIGTNSLYNNQGQGGGYSEIINERGPPETARLRHNNNDGSSPSSSNAGNVVVQDSCFRFLMGDNGDQQQGLWESYGLNKLNKGGND